MCRATFCNKIDLHIANRKDQKLSLANATVRRFLRCIFYRELRMSVPHNHTSQTDATAFFSFREPLRIFIFSLENTRLTYPPPNKISVE